MNKWMKTYWRTRKNANFQNSSDSPAEKTYAKKIGDIESLVIIDPLQIGKVQNPSDDLQKKAISKNWEAFRVLLNVGIVPSDDVTIYAAKRTWQILLLLEQRGLPISDRVFLATIKNNGHIIQMIDNPSEELQLIAVRQNAFAITHLLKNKNIEVSDEVMIAAVEHNPECLDGIQDYEGYKKRRDLIDWIAINKNPFSIKYMHYPSERVKSFAVHYKGSLIHYISNQNEELQYEAVRQDAINLQSCMKPISERVQILAAETAKFAYYLYDFINDFTENAQIVAVKRFPILTYYIENPSPKVSEAANRNF